MPAAALAERTKVVCVYCGDGRGDPVICAGCRRHARNEAVEVAAGLRPWPRPLRLNPGDVALGFKESEQALAAWLKRVSVDMDSRFTGYTLPDDLRDPDDEEESEEDKAAFRKKCKHRTVVPENSLDIAGRGRERCLECGMTHVVGRPWRKVPRRGL